MATPLISVVIPVGPKHGDHLDTALASIQYQTLTPEWIETIVIRDPQGRGAGWARNEGLARAKAPLICWLDADDYLTPQSLEALLRGYAHYDDAYIYGDWWDAWDDTRIEYRLAAAYDRLSHFRGGIHVVTTLMATADVRSINGFNNLKGWEDWDFWCRVTVAGFCGVRIDAPVLVYRIDQGFRRNESYAMQDELKKAHLDRYIGYINGEVPLMACCSGNKAAKQAARRALLGLDGSLLEEEMATKEDVRLEYVGSNRGPKSFRIRASGNTYTGARNGTNQYVNVRSEDVDALMSIAPFRRVPRMPAGHQAPPPVPHLIKDDVSDSETFEVPVDGQASPAPVVQFAPPPDATIEGLVEEYAAPPVVPLIAEAQARREAEKVAGTIQTPGSGPKRKNPKVLQ